MKIINEKIHELTKLNQNQFKLKITLINRVKMSLQLCMPLR